MRIFSICVFLLLAGCSTADTPHVTKGVRCTGFGGFEEKVCPVSMLALVANPDVYSGKVVAVQGVVADFGGTPMILPNSQFVVDRDSASAVICRSTEAWSCSKLLGRRATFMGTFSMTDLYDDDLFSPVGTITLMHVRGVRLAASGSAQALAR